MIVRNGATRHAFLIGRYAFKIPCLTNGWELFLCGLLGNIQEGKFSGSDSFFCPIKFKGWLGLLNVMMRAKALSNVEFSEIITDEFMDSHSMVIPCERKISSFGWLNGDIVCVDYGS